MHFYVQSIGISSGFQLLMMIMIVGMIMIRPIMLCSGSGADGPGREHVATDAQKVLVLLLLTEWLF